MSDFADIFIELSEGQKSALACLSQARNEGDDEAVRSIRHHMEAWDRHFGRESTELLARRKADAFRKFGSYLFENGGGI